MKLTSCFAQMTFQRHWQRWPAAHVASYHLPIFFYQKARSVIIPFYCGCCYILRLHRLPAKHSNTSGLHLHMCDDDPRMFLASTQSDRDIRRFLRVTKINEILRVFH